MKKHILIVPTVVLAVGGLGLFSVSASALPTSGVAAISKVNHVPDAAGLPVEHVQFPCGLCHVVRGLRSLRCAGSHRP